MLLGDHDYYAIFQGFETMKVNPYIDFYTGKEKTGIGQAARS